MTTVVLELASFLGESKNSVESLLRSFLEEKLNERKSLAPVESLLVAALAEFTLRGGKRLRPALVCASYADCGGSLEANDPGMRATRWLGVYLELLQSYLLIHDDWMDGDVERRGGPTMHVRMRELLRETGREQHTEAMAILCGDVASAYARQALTRALAEIPERAVALLTIADQIEREVVLGQELDVLGVGAWSDVFRLKTGSYSVLGPVRLGACAAGANVELTQALSYASQHLGLAFQLRDDLLGTFGDPKNTGKAVGRDLLRDSSSVMTFAREQISPSEVSTINASIVRAKNGEPDALDDAIRSLRSLGVEKMLEARVQSVADSARLTLKNFASRGFPFARMNAMIDLVSQRSR